MEKSKYFLLFLFFLLFSAVSYTQEGNSSYLNLSLYDGGKLSVTIDEKEPTVYSDEIEFDNLSSGKHYLKITRETNAMKKSPDIIFSDNVEIPSGCGVYAVIDEYGRFSAYKKIYGYYEKKHSHEHKCDCSCEYCRNCIYKKWKDETDPKDECRYKVMGESDFVILKNSVSSKSFETTKIDIIKQAVDINYFKADQVKQLLSLLEFDASKVEIAKYAYEKTCDKKNYYRINDVFSFESSISEVENYIREKNK